MDTEQSNDLKWIVAHLGDDMNWWLEQTSGEMKENDEVVGVLDPRQVAHLVEALDEYRASGLKKQMAAAFQVFAIESEVNEGLLRLRVADETIISVRSDLFALPRVTGDGEGPYYEFLDALGAAHIRRLNETHHYVQPCTEDDMYEELNAIDSNRYFSNESIHAFDQINEILQWNPTEWDASDSES
jgi:hypothetical protein